MKFFFGNAMWHLLVQSDLVTKCIMFGLLVLSIICWTVIFYKWVQLSDKTKQLTLLLTKMDGVKNSSDFNRLINDSTKLYGGVLVSEYVDEIKQMHSLNNKIDSYEKELLDEVRMKFPFWKDADPFRLL